MVKWADYLISAVSYNPNREITEVQVHQDLDGKMGPAEIVDKLTIAHNIRRGKSYVTIFQTLNSWKKGEYVNLFRIDGTPYIRIDKNKVNLDNLGELANIDYSKKKDPPSSSLSSTTPTSEKKTKNLEQVSSAPPSTPKPKPADTTKSTQSSSQQQPDTKPPQPATSPHGTLPAAGEVEIPFEKEQPEQVGLEPEPAEPELTELEPEPPEPEPAEPKEPSSSTVSSPHGTLPAAGEVEIPFEDIQPEQVSDDDVSKTVTTSESTTEQKPSSKEDSLEDYEKDYLKRLEKQRKIEEDIEIKAQEEKARQEEIKRQERLQREEEKRNQLKSKSSQSTSADSADNVSKPTDSPHGTLPAAGEIEIPFEDIQPEPVDLEPEPEPEEEEEDATPEQLEKLEQLEKQLAELESRKAEPSEPELGILNFVDPSKGPEHYVRRFH